MPVSPPKPENEIGKTADSFFREIGARYEGGNPLVLNEWVQDYLDEFAGIKSAILDEAEAKNQDPVLVEILHRFLSLSDERHEDGSMDRLMLSYHIRVAHRLSLHFLGHGSNDNAKALMRVLIGLNFNKPSVLDYYRQVVPKLMAAGTIPEPYGSLEEMFQWFEQFESFFLLLLPGKVSSYDSQEMSLLDCIKQAAGKK